MDKLLLIFNFKVIQKKNKNKNKNKKNFGWVAPPYVSLRLLLFFFLNLSSLYGDRNYVMEVP